MKNKIHPQYFIAKVKCACGASYDIPATKKEINIEICKNCSPVFTGKEERKTIGRVERFLRKQSKRK